MLGTNVTETPSFVHVLTGFGVIGVLAAVGWWRERTPSSLLPTHRAFLGLWALTHLCLAYAPFALQRRLLQGLAFPLAVLAAPALLAAAKALGFRAKGTRNNDALLVLGAIAVLLPSTATAFIRAIGSATVPDGIVREGVVTEENASFFGADEAAALAWLRAETAPDAIVLALPDTGNGIAGWAMRPVHVGHWANTIDIGRKHAETVAFFGLAATSQERVSYVARNGIDFVWVGRRERALGGDAFATDPGFEVVFSIGTVAVYAPR